MKELFYSLPILILLLIPYRVIGQQSVSVPVDQLIKDQIAPVAENAKAIREQMETFRKEAREDRLLFKTEMQKIADAFNAELGKLMERVNKFYEIVINCLRGMIVFLVAMAVFILANLKKGVSFLNLPEVVQNIQGTLTSINGRISNIEQSLERREGTNPSSTSGAHKPTGKVGYAENLMSEIPEIPDTADVDMYETLTRARSLHPHGA